jgi:hypothetical protein
MIDFNETHKTTGLLVRRIVYSYSFSYHDEETPDNESDYSYIYEMLSLQNLLLILFKKITTEPILLEQEF